MILLEITLLINQSKTVAQANPSLVNNEMQCKHIPELLYNTLFQLENIIKLYFKVRSILYAKATLMSLKSSKNW